MTTSGPRLRGVRQRVTDPAEAASFYVQVLGCTATTGPFDDWMTVDTGWGQALLLAPGGSVGPVLADRWQHQGVIPILRTLDLATAVANLEDAGVAWINEEFSYSMMGTGRLAYFHGPDNQPVGVQVREDDTERDEDHAAARRRERDGAGLVAGIGWTIFQAEDIVAARDFYDDAFGWRLRRGTEGFGYMMGIDDETTLQIAFRGRPEDPTRDVMKDATTGLLRGDADAIVAAAAVHGGSEVPAAHGLRGVVDHEGHAWLIDDTDERPRSS